MDHSSEEMEQHFRSQRKQLRRVLKTIRLEIDDLGSSFDATALLDLGIKRSAMSVEDKDFHPQYFGPYQAGIKMPREGEEAEEYIQKSFPTLEHEVCEEELEIDYKTAYHLQSYVFNIISLAILPQENECPPGVHDKQPGTFYFRTIYESRVPSWETKAVGEVPDETLPHIKCMISITGVEYGNSKALLRGKLILLNSILFMMCLP